MKKQKLNFIYFCVLHFFIWSFSASAYEYNHGSYGIKLAGYGTIGAIEPDFDKPVFIGDWRLRGQMNYSFASNKTFGLVYAIDELANYQNKFARDAFLFVENSGLGRAEAGFTDSVATKLGIGLPDVGGLRINDNPLFYKKTSYDVPVISNTTAASGRYYPRLNIVSAPSHPWQFGASVAGLSSDYKYAADFGVKYRKPEGKTKTTFSAGMSFIDSPENFQTDVFAPPVRAASRMQLSAGMNLQYNSWLFGVSARAIYDYKPVGMPADGVIAGAGVSYDLLKYSLSASYMLSDIGVWNDAKDNIEHTGLLSFRYKYSKEASVWISTGIGAGTPFVSAGLKFEF
ncbi:MAG: hypothetical protein LBD50_01525 [Rickettsiales bacterium]|jgi:hypothetical protein|nr:hypothetical protein [Rickettsiales bacterium]